MKKTISTQSSVRTELEKIDLDILQTVPFEYYHASGKDLDSITGHINDKTEYLIPYFRVYNFAEVFRGMSQIHNSAHPKRDDVWIYGNAVIKSGKKDLLHSTFDPGHKHAIKHAKSRVAAEMIVANQLSGKFTDTEFSDRLRLDVVAPIAMIGDHDRHGLKKPYLIEPRFEPFPNVGRELREDDFPSKSLFNKVMTGYQEFVERTESKGYNYIPANEERPYADLVWRQKRDGRIRVLATDWPYFVKI